jgi:hypothetical protein
MRGGAKRTFAIVASEADRITLIEQLKMRSLPSLPGTQQSIVAKTRAFRQ